MRAIKQFLMLIIFVLACKVSEAGFLAEISDLKIKLDTAEQQCSSEAESMKEMEAYYKKHLTDCHTEIEIFRNGKVMTFITVCVNMLCFLFL